MACFRTISLLMVFVLLFGHANGDPQVPCFFIFGDSLSDSGNNNQLDTKARANYEPYGIDFPGGTATGRFTNGKTAVDLIASFLGFEEPIPSFASASGEQILRGVNYASGSAGIRDETGDHLGKHVSLGKQLQNHQTTLKNLAAVGEKSPNVSHCLYTVNIGSNDYLNNYFIPNIYNSSTQYNPDQYAEALINEYTEHLKALYEAGARMIVFFGLGPIGCIPHSMMSKNSTDCVQEMNGPVMIFNKRLRPLVDRLKCELPSSQFIFINTFPTLSASKDPTPSTDFTVLNAPCCPLREDGQCDPRKSPCNDRNKYAFFDGFHPTEAAAKITAALAFNAPSAHDAYPFGISRLVQMGSLLHGEL